MPVTLSRLASWRRLFFSVRTFPNVASLSQGRSLFCGALVVAIFRASATRDQAPSSFCVAPKLLKNVTGKRSSGPMTLATTDMPSITAPLPQDAHARPPQ